LEGATLATVMLAVCIAPPESMSCPGNTYSLWGRYCQALFGTILLYYAAVQIGEVENALLWSELFQHAKQLNPEILEIALFSC